MNGNSGIIHSSPLFRFYVTTKSTHEIVDTSCARFIFSEHNESHTWDYWEIRKLPLVLVIKRRVSEIARIVPEWVRVY